jgi:hypothetical protein
MSQELKDMDTSQSLNISDDLINAVYNDFSAESMKYYKNIIVGLKRNFKRRKKTNKVEWNDFERVISLCMENKFNIRCYVKWCFLNRLVPHDKGHALKDISYLTHIQQIMAYSANKEEIESLYKVYISILKSIIRIKNTKKEQSDKSIEDIIKNVISSGRLGMFISTGGISRYFLSLIPNIENVSHDILHRNNNEDSHIVDDFCNCCQHYRKLSAKALKTFWPSAIGKNIIQLCSEK